MLQILHLYLPLTINDSPDTFALFFLDKTRFQMEDPEEYNIIFYLSIISYAVLLILTLKKEFELFDKYINYKNLIKPI